MRTVVCFLFVILLSLRLADAQVLAPGYAKVMTDPAVRIRGNSFVTPPEAAASRSDPNVVQRDQIRTADHHDRLEGHAASPIDDGTLEEKIQRIQFTRPVDPRTETQRNQSRLTEPSRSRQRRSAASFLSRSDFRRRPMADRVQGGEGRLRASTDAGSLLGKSGVLGLATQKRNPIIAEPRVRGSRVGSLGASGSYWVPARIDLDTAVSKIDPNIVASLNVIKGPYTVFHGPGTSFIDFELLPSPRSTTGLRTFGSTSVEYQTNGERF